MSAAFIFTKFVALTCVFFLGIAVVMDVGLLVSAHLGQPGGVIHSLRGWLNLLSLIWLASFFLSWHLLMSVGPPGTAK